MDDKDPKKWLKKLIIYAAIFTAALLFGMLFYELVYAPTSRFF